MRRWVGTQTTGLEALSDLRADAQGLVARSKNLALGLYAARSLSYEGVEYELVEHRLTPEQIRIYDAYVKYNPG